MSNFFKKVRHPKTGKVEQASWIDCHGEHGRYYMVFFPDGYSCKEADLRKNDVEALFGNLKKGGNSLEGFF